MKFADGPMVEVDVHIDARPDRVWELVTDIGLPARFSSEFQGADWLDGDGHRLGPGRSRLTGVIEARPDKEERIVALRLEELRANMQATVEGIKAVAEGRAA